MAALVFVPACSSLRTKEPRYEGKRLSSWVVKLNTFTNQQVTSAQYAAADATWTNVVRAVGTNGLPYYFNWLKDENDQNRQYRSQQAIEILGPAAESAIPVLAGFLKNDQTAFVASRCLLAIGPASIPALTEAMETLTNRGQQCAIMILGEFGPVAKSGIPALIQIVQSDTPSACPALQSLSVIETNTAVMLPLLAMHLSDTNCASGTAYALWRLGNDGVPYLLLSLTNELRLLRCCAAGALDPQYQKASRDIGEIISMGFPRQICEFNTKVLKAAAQCYSHGSKGFYIHGNKT